MINQRIAALRKLMKKHKIDAYIIPSTDAHASEYVPELWRRRVWISGFDGSAGDVIVTKNKAGLWTDSRYFLQAGQQLEGSGIDLYKMGVSGVPGMIEFLQSSLKKGQTVAVDPRLQSQNEAALLIKKMSAKNIKVKMIEENLVDALWKDQPDLPKDPVMVWDEKYAGESVKSKLTRIREKMDAESCDVHILTMLDAIAWTFNIRSNDVAFNPVVIAYAIITRTNAEVFISSKKLTGSLKSI